MLLYYFIGIYAVIGASLSKLILDSADIDAFIAAATAVGILMQCASDVCAFIFLFDRRTSYEAHFCGFIVGVIYCSSSILNKRKNQKQFKNPIFWWRICIFMLSILLTILLVQYCRQWPPVAGSFRYQTPKRIKYNNCCEEYFSIVNSKSQATISDKYYCMNDRLVLDPDLSTDFFNYW